MLFKKIFFYLLFFIALICNSPLLSAGGKPAEELNKVVPTENLSGLNLFIANMYNDQRLLFAILVTATMACLGLIIAFGTDLVLKKLSKRSSH